jgi:hypothetical protein
MYVHSIVKFRLILDIFRNLTRLFDIYFLDISLYHSAPMFTHVMLVIIIIVK